MLPFSTFLAKTVFHDRKILVPWMRNDYRPSIAISTTSWSLTILIFQTCAFFHQFGITFCTESNVWNYILPAKWLTFPKQKEAHWNINHKIYQYSIHQPQLPSKYTETKGITIRIVQNVPLYAVILGSQIQSRRNPKSREMVLGFFLN